MLSWAVIVGPPALSGSSSALASPAAKKILYQANFRQGKGGWKSGGGTWSIHNGVAGFDGNGAATFIPPYKLHTSKYAIVAKIRLIEYTSGACCRSESFGILFRSDGPEDPLSGAASGLVGGIFHLSAFGVTVAKAGIMTVGDQPDIYIPEIDYTPGNDWHLYRVEVRRNDIRVLIDGQEATHFNGLTRFLPNARLGLDAVGSHVEVASFKVIKL